MRSARYDKVSLVPFDLVTRTSRGVILKAGLISSAPTEAGIGLNGSFSAGTAADWVFSSAGVYKNLASYRAIRQSLTVEQATQLLNAGSVQFEILRSTLSLVTDTSYKSIIDLYDGSVQAALARSFYVAGGAAPNTGYRIYTEGRSGAVNNTTAIGITPSSAFALDVPNLCLHDTTTVNSDGYITVGISWEGLWAWYFINGVPVAKWRRKIPALNTAASYMHIMYDNFTVGAAPTIRNLLVMNHALANPMHDPSAYRVQLLMHSFGNTANANLEWVADGVTNYWDGNSSLTGTYVYATEQSITPSILRNSGNKLRIINTSKGAQSTTWMLAQVTNSASADGRFYPASHSGCTPRYRPHFIVVGGHLNDTVAGTTTTNIAAIAAGCVAAGVVPIFLREQNGDKAASVVDHSGAGGIAEAFDTAALLARTTHGDVGYADLWSATGGATVSNTYVESNNTALHPTWAAQELYGAAISAEIDRLIASPPAYAWWK